MFLLLLLLLLFLLLFLFAGRNGVVIAVVVVAVVVAAVVPYFVYSLVDCATSWIRCFISLQPPMSRDSGHAANEMPEIQAETSSG